MVDSNNNRVLVFDVATSTIHDGEDAENVLGQPDFTSNNVTTTQSGLNFPDDAVYDSVDNRLFVTDQGNSRILVFDVATSTIHDGEDAENVLGQPDFTSDAATTTQSGVSDVVMTDFDSSSSRLFVTENSNHRILIFDVATSTIHDGEDAENVLGQPDFTSKAAMTTQSGTSFFDGVSYDPVNNIIFAADTGNNRVLVFDVATSTIHDGEDAENVLGQADFTSSDFGASQQMFSEVSLSDVVYDAVNRKLFVDDGGNNRVLQFNFITIKTSSLPDGTVDTLYSQTINTTSSQGSVSFSVYDGSLPSGFTMDSSSGVISGTPT
ncbi:MAG: putative Ig domain-containing protein, partial [Minisyncoccia bacterium]